MCANVLWGVLLFSGATGAPATLCANPSTRSLRALALTKASLTHEAVEALVETTWPKLQVLTMHDNNLRTPAFDLLLPWLNAQPCLEVFDAGSAFLQFIERRRQVPINFEVTTVLSYRGLTDRELAPHHVFTTLG